MPKYKIIQNVVPLEIVPLDAKEFHRLIALLPARDENNKVFGIVIHDDTNRMVYKIYTDNGTDFKGKELYVYTGSPVQRVEIFGDKYIWLNENGKLDGLPQNTIATILFGLFPSDIIMGNVVVCGYDSVL